MQPSDQSNLTNDSQQPNNAGQDSQLSTLSQLGTDSGSAGQFTNQNRTAEQQTGSLNLQSMFPQNLASDLGLGNSPNPAGNDLASMASQFTAMGQAYDKLGQEFGALGKDLTALNTDIQNVTNDISGLVASLSGSAGGNGALGGGGDYTGGNAGGIDNTGSSAGGNAGWGAGSDGSGGGAGGIGAPAGGGGADTPTSAGTGTDSGNTGGNGGWGAGSDTGATGGGAPAGGDTGAATGGNNAGGDTGATTAGNNAGGDTGATTGGGSPIAAGTGTDTPVTPGTPTTAGATGNGFEINNGQLLVNGKLLNGVAVTGEYAQQVGGQALADQLTSQFPGINVVRLSTSPDGGAFSNGSQVPGGETIDNIQQTIAALNAKGIGVVIDNHASDANTPNNVAQNGNEAAWFSQLAQLNQGNNMVMFQSENEPMGSDADITAEQQAVYNAVRGTGSNAVVAFDMVGGGGASPFQSNPSAYDSMTNYVIDAHAYASNNPDPASALQQEIASVSNLTEANGSKVPVYIGETGNSIDGSNVDPAQAQLLQSVWSDGTGGIAWLYDGAATGFAGEDHLTNPDGSLTSYGQEAAGLIKQGAS